MASLKFGYFCPLPPFGKLFSTKPNMVTNFLISILHILEAWRNLWTTYLCSTKFFNVYSNVGKNIVLKYTLRIRPDKVQKIRNCEKKRNKFLCGNPSATQYANTPEFFSLVLLSSFGTLFTYNSKRIPKALISFSIISRTIYKWSISSNFNNVARLCKMA